MKYGLFTSIFSSTMSLAILCLIPSAILPLYFLVTELWLSGVAQLPLRSGGLGPEQSSQSVFQELHGSFIYSALSIVTLHLMVGETCERLLKRMYVMHTYLPYRNKINSFILNHFTALLTRFTSKSTSSSSKGFTRRCY